MTKLERLKAQLNETLAKSSEANARHDAWLQKRADLDIIESVASSEDEKALAAYRIARREGVPLFF